MCVYYDLINTLSLKVVTGWVSLFCHLLCPTSHVSYCCQWLVTIRSALEITSTRFLSFISLFFKNYFVYYIFFPSLAAVSSGLWHQIVICSFASLTPPHMAQENWKWKRWKLMLRGPPPPHTRYSYPHPGSNNDTFQNVDVGLYASQAEPSLCLLNQISTGTGFDAQKF